MNKGGRPTYAEEKKKYEDLERVFLTPVSVNKLQEKIAAGTFSPADRFLGDLLSDDGAPTRKAVANKLWPDRAPVDKEGKVQPVHVYLPKQDE
jgi:hypothetical protein